MGNKKLYGYEPDYAVPPGITLGEVLDSLNMTQVDLSRRTGKTQKTITQIIKGLAPITSATAIELERATGAPAKFWNNLESNYREQLAYIEERKMLGQKIKWLKQLPTKDMIKEGWLKKMNNDILQLREVLNFFGVASPKQWKQIWEAPQCAFRQSQVFKSNPKAVSAWLREGEIRASEISCEPYNKNTFKGNLFQIRNLTGKKPDVFEPELKRLCAEAGIAVVFVREIPGVRVSGVSRWLGTNKALIQLTIRYKTDDQLWFTFFHEASHILLHGKKQVFIDDNKNANDRMEQEANKLCSSLLIPHEEYEHFSKATSFSKRSIKEFAKNIGIAPSIVLGRLQHDDKVPYDRYYDLKMKLEWAN